MTVLTLQPDAAAGKDTWAWKTNPDTNYGTETVLYLEEDVNSSSVFLPYIEFNLDEVPPGLLISSGILQLYCFEDAGSSAACTVIVHRAGAPWAEDTLTWNDQPGVTGDVLDSVVVPLAGSLNIWISFDITATVQGWLDGDFVNSGVRLASDAARNGSMRKFHSSDYGTASLRPKLVITSPLWSTSKMAGGFFG